MAAGYVDTSGVRLWYQELGRADGAPVLLVMGGGASVVWWPPELLGGLVGAGYRVVQFDNRDVGLSSYVDWSRQVSSDRLDDQTDDQAAGRRDTAAVCQGRTSPVGRAASVAVQ